MSGIERRKKELVRYFFLLFVRSGRTESTPIYSAKFDSEIAGAIFVLFNFLP